MSNDKAIPVYRGFEFTVQSHDDPSVELINLLSQAVFKFRGDLTQDELSAAAVWFKERFYGMDAE